VIFSETIKNNILFGREFSADLYQRVIEQSCLISDFEILDKGDETLVGERGITLSGGQKARVSLARALYAEADIYLLDDPISAVDSKVARNIQEKCIKPLSKKKTVILVTHQISYLYECEKVIILE
jgi:ATP-binding cassette subfamily C (CFTR/MRP) protein 4